MRVMSLSFLMLYGRKPVLESPSNQGRGTKWSVAAESVFRGKERPKARGVGRLSTPPGPERPMTPLPRRENQMAEGLAQTVPTGAGGDGGPRPPEGQREALGPTLGTRDSHLLLRQRPEGPLSGCPEHGWRGIPRQRCGGIAPRDKQARKGLPWRNSAKYGLARSAGQLIFGTGPTRSEAARDGRKLWWGEGCPSLLY